MRKTVSTKEQFGVLLDWSPELESAYWDVLDNAVKVGECFLYLGKPNNRGYGVRKVRGKTMGVHHIVLLYTVGSRPLGKEAGHLCGNRLCVNSEHLVWLSKRQNSRMREYEQFMGELLSRTTQKVDFCRARLTAPLPTTLNLNFFSDAMDLSALYQ